MVEARDGPPTVLIADDERGMLELFSAYLPADYETRTAKDGAEALELVDESVDVAILDRRMPNKSGEEVLRELRAAGYRFPVAMLTAVQADVDIIDMPFDAYVTKPVSRDEFVDIVYVLVRRQQYDEQTREFFRLAAKKKSLRANPKVDTGEGSEFNQLVERMETLRGELNSILEELIQEERVLPAEQD